MRLHELPAPQFIADDHVAADRNPLSADNGVNRVQLLAETQVPDPFEGSEIGIDRPRDRQPLPPGRRFRIVVYPIIVDQRKTQEIGMKAHLKDFATVGFEPILLMVSETVFLAILVIGFIVFAR